MWRRKKPTPRSLEATEARIRAEADLEQRRNDATRVQVMLAEWRRTRERNGIREAFEASLRGRHS